MSMDDVSVRVRFAQTVRPTLDTVANLTEQRILEEPQFAEVLRDGWLTHVAGKVGVTCHPGISPQ
jgi:hypothetical protein